RRRLGDDGPRTATSAEQSKVEDIVQEIFDAYRSKHSASQFVLQREKHSHYLKKGLRQLSSAYECLDASRPWLCYWILHSLELLDEPLPDSVGSDVCQFLSLCQSPKGGFGGGPQQYPHLAPTYAAVNTLCIIGTEEAFGVIDRYGRRGLGGGSSQVERGWEGQDARVVPPPQQPRWLSQEEAAGRWVTSRQMHFEGGFQGRCNKLVDGCYSFWQAGLLPLLHRALHARGDTALSMRRWMFDQLALQEYILLCCQCPAGGLIDKPGKSRDFYHTCYCLSGLAIAQHFGSGDLHQEFVLGVPENRLHPTHPVYNIGPEKVTRAVMHFLQLPVP
ncbi:FNTB farnesyltransferase, partial [Rissa tridactyla]|nr:FNTB farnesyltransferase [Rissa tridactyla]